MWKLTNEFFKKQWLLYRSGLKKKKKKKKKKLPPSHSCASPLDPSTAFTICFVCSRPLPSCITILVPVWKLTISYSGKIKKKTIHLAEV